ncbi:MAG TPA: hypothetical protein VIW95_14190 [Candidatus Binatus sp.]|uniref:hypothetical protein n=1 Tax=Candidatus Binatus sp. TaxID=2811406 RepID=UPI002F4147D3
MKRIVISLVLFVAASLVTLASPVLAEEGTPLSQPLQGYYTYGQLQGLTTEEAIRGAVAATTIPMGIYSVTASRDSNTYQGVVVGRSPFFHGARTTTIPTFIVPVKIKTSDGHVFDPSVTDSTCLSGKEPLTVFQNSPLFQPVAFTMNGVGVGTTQYADAFERAEFWQNVSVTGNRFHTKLSSPPTTLAEQTLTLTSGQGDDFATGCSGHLGIMDFSTFDSFVQGTIVPLVSSNGGGPTSFPIILLYNVVMASPFESADPTQNCCILGYHNVFSNPVQTYGVMDFDSTEGTFNGTSDISPSSHEINEWVNDPLGNNPTPAWGNIGQVTGCQNNFEVGDPLSGTLFPAVTLSSFTYHMQELAFFSWFYGHPSIGTGTSDFSNNDTFTSDAGSICF